jgi:biopolymer transport protein ExbD
MASQIGNKDGEAGFQIAPMVDVVFVLVLFFMASAGLQQVEQQLSAPLPGPPGETAPVPPVFVDIDAAGQVSINELVIGAAGTGNLGELTRFLNEAVAPTLGDRGGVIIRPEPETRHQRLMDVLNAISQSKVRNIAFS